MIESLIVLVVVVLFIAIVAYVVSTFLGQPAGLITFVVLLLLVLLVYAPHLH